MVTHLDSNLQTPAPTGEVLQRWFFHGKERRIVREQNRLDCLIYSVSGDLLSREENIKYPSEQNAICVPYESVDEVREFINKPKFLTRSPPYFWDDRKIYLFPRLCRWEIQKPNTPTEHVRYNEMRDGPIEAVEKQWNDFYIKEITHINSRVSDVILARKPFYFWDDRKIYLLPHLCQWEVQKPNTPTEYVRYQMCDGPIETVEKRWNDFYVKKITYISGRVNDVILAKKPFLSIFDPSQSYSQFEFAVTLIGVEQSGTLGGTLGYHHAMLIIEGIVTNGINNVVNQGKAIKKKHGDPFMLSIDAALTEDHLCGRGRPRIRPTNVDFLQRTCKLKSYTWLKPADCIKGLIDKVANSINEEINFFLLANGIVDDSLNCMAYLKDRVLPLADITLFKTSVFHHVENYTHRSSWAARESLDDYSRKGPAGLSRTQYALLMASLKMSAYPQIQHPTAREWIEQEEKERAVKYLRMENKEPEMDEVRQQPNEEMPRSANKVVSLVAIVFGPGVALTVAPLILLRLILQCRRKS